MVGVWFHPRGNLSFKSVVSRTTVSRNKIIAAYRVVKGNIKKSDHNHLTRVSLITRRRRSISY